MYSNIYRKIQSFSCIIKDESIEYYSVLGDYVKMSLSGENLSVAKALNEDVSVYSICLVKGEIVRIDNNDNKIIDANGKVCIQFNEFKCNDFIRFAKVYNDELYVLGGRNDLYSKVNPLSFKYQYKKLEKTYSFIYSLNDGAVFIDLNGELELFDYNINDIRCKISSSMLVDVSSIAKKSDTEIYILRQNGELILYNTFEETLTVVKKINESFKGYLNMHYVAGKLIILPINKNNRVRIIECDKDYKLSEVDYPENIEMFYEQNYTFVRGTENEKMIVYPIRGMDHFLVINKYDGLLQWIKPSLSDEVIKYFEQKPMPEMMKEEFYSLSEFISGVKKR